MAEPFAGCSRYTLVDSFLVRHWPRLVNSISIQAGFSPGFASHSFAFPDELGYRDHEMEIPDKSGNSQHRVSANFAERFSRGYSWDYFSQPNRRSIGSGFQSSFSEKVSGFCFSCLRKFLSIYRYFITRWSLQFGIRFFPFYGFLATLGFRFGSFRAGFHAADALSRKDSFPGGFNCNALGNCLHRN